MIARSRLLAWAAARKSLLGTVTGASLVGALVATIAVVSTGYPAQKVQLDDAAVWVTSDLHQAAARANPQIGELNTAVRMSSGSLSVSQFGQTVAVVDLGGGEAQLIDTSGATVADTVTLPVGEVSVTMSATTVLIASRTTGDVWVTTPAALPSFDPAAPADLTLGAGGEAVLTASGAVVGVSPATGSVVSLDPAAAGQARTGDAADPRPIDVATDADVSITAVGDSWAVLDRSTGRLITRDGVIPLDGLTASGAAGSDGASAGGDSGGGTGTSGGVGTSTGSGTSTGDGTAGAGPARASGTAAWLQQPSPAGSDVLVATGQALYSVPLAGGDVRTLSSGHSGTSVSPVEAAGCWHAAWTDGRSWSRCADGAGNGTGRNEAGTNGTADTNGAEAGTNGTTGTDDPASGTESTLPGASAGATLAFRTNGTGGILLSDASTGRSWDVTRGNAVIDDWDALLPDTTADQQSEAPVTDEPAQADPEQRPPVATDDQLGARPGRSSVLPVLLNDYDPNGDVIVIDSVQLPDGVDCTVDAISDGQQLQLTLPPTASGELAFGYTISDGRGGTDQATVTVTVRTPDQNSAPVQSTRTAIDVALGGRARTDIRSDWYDPDGDAFFVQSAAVPAPDAVTFTPDGVVTYTDSGQAAGAKEVTVTVGDGQDTATGSILVRVHPAEEVPLVASGFVVPVHVGQEVQVAPLERVTGGGPGLRLSNVPTRDGFSIAPDYAGGTVRITAQSAGSTLLDYAVVDGARTATGVIRVIATPAPDANTRPVTVPHSAFARQNAAVLVDVLAGDFDPAGGVLIVSGVDGVPVADGVRVEVIEQRMIRVTLTKPLPGGRTAFGYTVTNGLAEARGSVTVVEIPEPAQRQPPIALPDSASVRVGDVVDIPVLANDVHPDGDALSLHPELVRGLGADAGLLFTSGQVLRYLAPDTPGDFTAVYRVDAPDGQWATADVTISVREADPTANAAPVPGRLTARVIAGETVRIPVPLTGIDPDGDSVQFLGIDSVPDKGTVTDTGPDWIDFEAGEYSTGTDSFTYTVVDRLGARATGTVRVGISARLDGARNPVATPDEVTVRPGRTVFIRVLQNDSDPDGSPLSITEVSPLTAGATAVVQDDLLAVTAPAAPGRYGFIYTIANERGGTSSSFATVEVSADAPLARPQVSDTVLSLSDILGVRTVDVPVLDNVFFAEGPSAALRLSVLPAYSGSAEVVDGIVRVTVRPERQLIPFSVAHPEDPSITSTGFIWVPGTDDALPQLRTGAPKLTVTSGAELTIPLADYVVAVGSGPVVITDPNSVRATHADRSSLVSDRRTLVFRSADQYFGPASISFEVADGEGTGARTATLVLPITVTPRENQPPVFTGAVLEFEPGQQKTIDLAKLTAAAAGSPAVGYQILDPRPAGFSAVLLGTALTISVDVGTKKGAQGGFVIGVSSGGVAGKSGRIDVTVVSSTKPLAAPATDTVVAPRGQTTTVDVLANDAATNPFPQIPLTVIAVRGADAGALPPGVVITPSDDKSRLQITVAPDAPPTDVSVQYQVLDGTGEPDRATWGTVRIAVQDRPGPVTGLTVTGFGDRTLTVSFSPGPSNNSAITGFEVVARTAAGAATTTRCGGTSCVVGTPGNGPSNAVSVSVIARNAIGTSDQVVSPTPVWSDLVPAAPTTLSLAPRDGELEARWTPSSVPAGGSPVRQYDVAVDGRPVQSVDAGTCDGSGCRTTVRGLVNGSAATVTVTARNGAFPALAVWPSTSTVGTPYGAPVASPPSAVATPDAPAASGTASITVSWPAFGGNGDAVKGYYAQLLAPGQTTVPGGAQACSVSSPAPGTVSAPSVGGAVAAQQSTTGLSATFGGFTLADSSRSFVVWGWNGAGCVASTVVSASVFPVPPAIDASQVGVRMVPRDDGIRVEAQLVSVPVTADRYRVRAVDSSGAPTGSPVSVSLGGIPREITGGAFGEKYRFVIQACSDWLGVELCGPFSAPVTAPEPSLTFEFGTRPDYDGTSWSWADDPPNGTLVPTIYCGTRAVDPAGGATPAATPTSCRPDPPVADGDAGLWVQIAGHRYVYRG